MNKLIPIVIIVMSLIGAVTITACATSSEALTQATQSASPAVNRAPDISDLAFLEGSWRGGDDSFVFEEIWTGADGNVMTAMARGVRDDQLAVLEYIIVQQTGAIVTMRFKHFNADYSVWASDEAAPITLVLSSARPNDALFVAATDDAPVRSIRYFMTATGQLQADIALLEDGEPGGFSLVFDPIGR